MKPFEGYKKKEGGLKDQRKKTNESVFTPISMFPP